MRATVTITLPATTLAALDGYASERGLPRSYAAQDLLERLLVHWRPDGPERPAPVTDSTAGPSPGAGA